MSALLAKYLDEPCLVIAPPHLLDGHNPGSWPNVFRDFGVRGFLCESLGKLESLLEHDLPEFTTVFIDESHRFRTEDTQSYEKLAQICRSGKKWMRVVLVGAHLRGGLPSELVWVPPASQCAPSPRCHHSSLAPRRCGATIPTSCGTTAMVCGDCLGVYRGKLIR